MIKKLLTPVFLVFFSGLLSAQTPLDTAVNFTVKDVKGITHHLNNYLEQDKLVVADFFTVTCGPCVTYAPEINAAYEYFGCNTGNVIFLGINWGANNRQVTEFCDAYGAYYPAASGLEGNGNHVVNDYQLLSYPTVILIKPGGAIAENYIWPPSQQHLDSVITSCGGISMPCNTGIQEAPETNDPVLKVFPNPATGSVSIQTSLSGDLTLSLVSVMGSAVRQEEFLRSPSDPYILNLTGVLPGYYTVIIRSHGTIVGSSPLLVGRTGCR